MNETDLVRLTINARIERHRGHCKTKEGPYLIHTRKVRTLFLEKKKIAPDSEQWVAFGLPKKGYQRHAIGKIACAQYWIMMPAGDSAINAATVCH